MQKILGALLMSLVAGSFYMGNAYAEEPAGSVPNAALAQFGLAGMQTVSDAEGSQIRGKFIINPNGTTVGELFAAIDARFDDTVTEILTLTIENAINDLNSAAAAALADATSTLPITLVVDPGFFIIN